MNILAIVTTTAIIITNDYGGSVYDYYVQIQDYEQKEIKLEIDGFCASACTMYLKIACVHKDAILAFHGPTISKHLGNNDLVKSTVTKILADHYPKSLRNWFYQNAAHLSGSEYITLTGEQVSAHGVKLCS